MTGTVKGKGAEKYEEASREPFGSSGLKIAQRGRLNVNASIKLRGGGEMRLKAEKS